jgi:hypothetical protein
LIDLPDSAKAYDFENAFYQSCKPERIGKLLAHYELYKLASGLAGAYMECGIFKGPSFLRFAMFRRLFESASERELVGFDIFGRFPRTAGSEDKEMLERFLASAGEEGLSQAQLQQLLRDKDCAENVTLVEGDILKTVPRFVKGRPDLRIALLHLDVDLFEPSYCVLENLYPHMVAGGILILDDHDVFPGATRAVENYFSGRPERIQRHPWIGAPTYIVCANQV